MKTQEDTIGIALNRMIDDYIDNLRSNGSIRKPNIKSLMNVYKPAKKDLKALLSDFNIMFNDVNGAIKEEDDQLVEAWEFLSKTKLNHLKDFVENVNSFLEENSKIVRKKRKQNPVKLIKNLKYAEENKKLKIKSVNPIDIIGCNTCILYHPKTNKIVFLESKNGMTVSGTTIKNFDESSFMKAVRNRKNVLTQITEGTSLSAKNIIITQLSSKEVAATGRTNDETIILRAGK
jgi:hypothetical protein